jgi:hypothetical protein
MTHEKVFNAYIGKEVIGMIRKLAWSEEFIND